MVEKVLILQIWPEKMETVFKTKNSSKNDKRVAYQAACLDVVAMAVSGNVEKFSLR